MTGVALDRLVKRPSEAVRAADPHEVEAWISSIQLTAEEVRPERSVRAVAADPDDDKYIDPAIQGNADFVVSGDSHLLKLREFQGVRIVTARAFLGTIAR